MIKQISDAYYSLIYEKVSERNPDSPLLYFLRRVRRFKELHSRRMKTDPAASRTKTDHVKNGYNAVTLEKYNPENIDHKSWRLLILNPLPSDYNANAIDPEEGDETHRLNVDVMKIQNDYRVKDPFSIIVPQEFDKIIRLMHTLIFFEQYLHSYIIGCITEEDHKVMKELSWKDTWKLLFKEFSDVQLEKIKRVKKKIPLIVGRTAELRDMIKEAIKFVN